MKWFANLLRKSGILEWFLKEIGDVGAHHYLLKADSVSKLYKMSMPGDIIVCKAPYELSTIQQDLVGECEFTHATFVHDTETISDMTGSGLDKRVIWNTMQGNNRIALLRKKNITDEQRIDLMEVAENLIEEGADYDYDFSLNNNIVSKDISKISKIKSYFSKVYYKIFPKKISNAEVKATKLKKAMYYCSEYCYKIYNTVFPDSLGLREQFGELVITPTDLYKSEEFYIVCEIKGHE